MSLTLAREELREFISSGETQKAIENLADKEDGGIDGDGNTLYHQAVLDQDNQLLRWLIVNYQDRVPVTRANTEGATCFHMACTAGRTSVFQTLWEHPNVSQKTLCKIADGAGRTPLHVACLYGQEDVVRDLLNSKYVADFLYDRTSASQTALHIAAARGNISCVRLLCYYKQLIDAMDSFGATALHYACNEGHVVTAQYLIERCKADKMKTTHNNMNVVHAAVASGDERTIAYILSKTKKHQYIAKTSTQATVLHIATGMNYAGVLASLLENKNIYSLINEQEMNGWTAAHLAALRNRAACLAVLLPRAADVYNIKDKNGVSAYQMMRNNESREMRETFPYFYRQIDALSGYNKSELQRNSMHRSNDTPHPAPLHRYVHSGTGYRGVDYPPQPIDRQLSPKGRSEYERRRSSGSQTRSDDEDVKLTESFIMKNKMEFTKTNPIADDDSVESPSQLRLRRFKKNTMALPQSSTDTMAIMSYQKGDKENSDAELDIEDIEEVPETPMRKIQEYNNFRRSTYTPTQSTEDLTKEDSKTVTVTKSVPAEVDLIEHDEAVTGDGNNNINNNGPAIKPGLTDVAQAHGMRYQFSDSDGELETIPDDSTSGAPLPIILDYQSRLVDDNDAVTIYFHNGELNTVKVKTVKGPRDKHNTREAKISPSSKVDKSGYNNSRPSTSYDSNPEENTEKTVISTAHYPSITRQVTVESISESGGEDIPLSLKDMQGNEPDKHNSMPLPDYKIHTVPEDNKVYEPLVQIMPSAPGTYTTMVSVYDDQQSENKSIIAPSVPSSTVQRDAVKENRPDVSISPPVLVYTENFAKLPLEALKIPEQQPERTTKYQHSTLTTIIPPVASVAPPAPVHVANFASFQLVAPQRSAEQGKVSGHTESPVLTSASQLATMELSQYIRDIDQYEIPNNTLGDGIEYAHAARSDSPIQPGHGVSTMSTRSSPSQPRSRTSSGSRSPSTYHQHASMLISLGQDELLQSANDRPTEITSSSYQATGEVRATSKTTRSVTPPSPDSQTISSPTILQDGRFSFQVLDQNISHNAGEVLPQLKRVEFGSTDVIPSSPEGIETRYLSYAKNNLHYDEDSHFVQVVSTDQYGSNSQLKPRPNSILDRVNLYEDQSKGETGLEDQSGEGVEPIYAVINKRQENNEQIDRRPLRRMSSNASEGSEANFDLKSSTAYKFNYRAYRKRISNKNDTVTDLFEYAPVTQ